MPQNAAAELTVIAAKLCIDRKQHGVKTPGAEPGITRAHLSLTKHLDFVNEQAEIDRSPYLSENVQWEKSLQKLLSLHLSFGQIKTMLT